MVISQYFLRIGLAFLFGAMIGAERQTRQKNAGMRTNTLVCIGSAAFILLSFSLTGESGDPSRIAAQIVTGVGFLGGGLILKDGFSVRGLNTAATIWCSAAVGALAGSGLFIEALLMVLFIIVTNCVLRPVGEFIGRHNFLKGGSKENMRYELTIRCKEQIENHLRVLMLGAISNDAHLQLRSLKSTDDDTPNYCFVIAEIYSQGKHDAVIEKLAAKLTIEYGVTEVSWEVNSSGDEC